MEIHLRASRVVRLRDSRQHVSACSVLLTVAAGEIDVRVRTVRLCVRLS